MDAVKAWCSNSTSAEEKYGHISNWDVSNVTDMKGLFKDHKYFNNDISGWNTSNVTTMEDMFFQACAFNQPLNSWNTSKVTTMEDMFWEASAINSNNKPRGA